MAEIMGLAADRAYEREQALIRLRIEAKDRGGEKRHKGVQSSMDTFDRTSEDARKQA